MNAGNEVSQAQQRQDAPSDPGQYQPAPLQPCINFVMPFLAQWQVGRRMMHIHWCLPYAPLEATGQALKRKEA
jgi:hypothetical protein